MNVLKKVAEKNKEVPIGYMWTSALAQADIEKTLDLGGSGYPALAVVRPSTKM